jgi:hypothetical protein
MDAIQCNLSQTLLSFVFVFCICLLSFVVKKASTLQGQTFQRLASWVLQHNPQPEVPFQVDDDSGKKKLVLGHPYMYYNVCPHHRGELMEGHVLQRKQGPGPI